eukprot:g4754.t1
MLAALRGGAGVVGRSARGGRVLQAGRRMRGRGTAVGALCRGKATASARGGAKAKGGNGGRLLDAYLELLESKPLLTKSVTSMFIVGSGDMLCQGLLEDGPFDVKRLCVFTFLGGALIGPALHLWYGTLNRIIPQQTTAGALKRLALDQFVFAGPFIATFMSSALTLNGRPEQIPAQLKKEWFPALVTNWQLWFPANFINFRLIAPRFQVLFANVVALGWNSYLSLVSNREASNVGTDDEEGQQSQGIANPKTIEAPKNNHLVHRQSRRQDNFVYLKFVTTDQLVNEIERRVRLANEADERENAAEAARRSSAMVDGGKKGKDSP